MKKKQKHWLAACIFPNRRSFKKISSELNTCCVPQASLPFKLNSLRCLYYICRESVSQMPVNRVLFGRVSEEEEKKIFFNSKRYWLLLCYAFVFSFQCNFFLSFVTNKKKRRKKSNMHIAYLWFWLISGNSKQTPTTSNKKKNEKFTKHKRKREKKTHIYKNISILKMCPNENE